MTDDLLDLDEKFGTNVKAEIEGIWIHLGPTAALKIARLGNKEAARAWRKIPKAIRVALDEGAIADTQAENFLASYLAEHILKDWKGLSQNGKELPPYDQTIGAKILREKRRFRDRVMEIAQDDDLFNVEAEQDAKNLLEGSSGGLSTTQTQSKLSAVGS